MTPRLLIADKMDKVAGRGYEKWGGSSGLGRMRPPVSIMTQSTPWWDVTSNGMFVFKPETPE